MEVLNHRVTKFAVVLSMLVAALPLRADSLTEDKVKAAFIFNFTRFIKWPPESLASARDPFTICTETTASLEDALEDTVRDKLLDGHSFRMRKLRRESDTHTCQLVVYSGKANIQAATGVLSIVDDNATPAGSESGVITFVLDVNRLRFVINSKAAEQAGLVISSKLLTLAVRVDH